MPQSISQSKKDLLALYGHTINTDLETGWNPNHFTCLLPRNKQFYHNGINCRILNNFSFNESFNEKNSSL